MLRDLGEHRLNDVNRPEHVYQLDSADSSADFPTLKTWDQRPNNLPNQPTSFIGREHELAEVKELLATTNRLTLTGTGGQRPQATSLSGGQIAPAGAHDSARCAVALRE